MTTLTLDPGPTVGAVASAVNYGQSVDLTSAILAAATPGLKGDTLSVVADNASATLGAVSLVNGQLTYSANTAALSHIAANGQQTDSLDYTISDQYGDVTTGTVRLTIGNPADIINAYGWFNTIFVNGGNDLVNAGAGADTVYTGSGDVVVNLNGYFDQVSGGDGWDRVSGSQGFASILLGNGDDHVSVGGDGNAIKLGGGVDTVTLGGGQVDAVTLNGSTANVSGASGGETVYANGGADTLAFAGQGDVAWLNGTLTASIADGASRLLLKVESNTQTLTVTGFGTTDAHGVIDLLNGAGGYKTAAAAFHALHSDSHGGMILTLGSTGSIDFASTAASQLHANNFRIA